MDFLKDFRLLNMEKSPLSRSSGVVQGLCPHLCVRGGDPWRHHPEEKEKKNQEMKKRRKKKKPERNWVFSRKKNMKKYEKMERFCSFRRFRRFRRFP